MDESPLKSKRCARKKVMGKYGETLISPVIESILPLFCENLNRKPVGQKGPRRDKMNHITF
jgi:hypothetical protein